MDEISDNAGAGGKSEISSEETFELLNTDDKPEETEEEVLELPKTKKEKTDDDEEVEEETEEIDELKEIEEELEEPDEEKLELTTPARRRDILKKYPQLFKDFPYLEKAYYREQQFTELLPTIEDAKVAVAKAQTLDKFEADIMDGNFESVLSSVKEEDANSFNKIVDNYLPTLMKVDQQAYYHVLGNVLKDTIITMVRESQALGEEGQPLKSAANILHQFVFGTTKFTPPQKLSKQVDEKENSKEQELRQREQQMLEGKFIEVRDDLQSRADNTLKATIDAHIDPKKSMTDYVRRNASREAFESLEQLIVKDTRFKSLLDKLWEKAFSENFSKNSTDRIKSAYLSKAKTLLPAVIKRARNDALKGLGKRTTDLETVNEETETEEPVRRVLSNSTNTKKGEIPKGMKTLDFLMQD
jgi:hypothetical protein